MLDIWNLEFGIWNLNEKLSSNNMNHNNTNTNTNTNNSKDTMTFAVVLKNYEQNKKSIPTMVSSFEEFKALLQNEKSYSRIRHIERTTPRKIRKGSEYPSNEKYILYDEIELCATLFIKRKLSSMLSLKSKYELEKISKWQLVKFSLRDSSSHKEKDGKQSQNQKSNSHNHNQITTFRITELSQGPMFVIYKGKKESSSFLEKMPLFMDRVEDQLSDFTNKDYEKIIVWDTNVDFDSKCRIYPEFSPEILMKSESSGDSNDSDDENITNKIMLIDVDAVPMKYMAHFMDIINDFRPNKTCIVVMIREDNEFIKNIDMADHIMITEEVSDPVLKLIYKQNELRDLKTFSKFSFCVKQVMSQVGQIIISKGKKDMKWFR